MKRLLIALACAGGLTALGVAAQTPPGAPPLPPGAAPQAPRANPATPAAPASSMPAPGRAATKTDRTTVSLSQPAAMNGNPSLLATFPELARDPRLVGIPLDKVIVKGVATASQDPRRGDNLVAVTWHGVETQDGKKAATFATPLSSRFATGQKTLSPGTQIPARGDLDSVVVAIKSLFENKKDEEQARQADSAKKSAPPPTASGAPSSNDVAKNYQPIAASEAKEEAAPSYGVTSEGCEPRVDFAQNVVIQTSATTETKEGVTTKGACTDSEVRFPILYSSAECSDEVVIGDLKAYPRRKSYYVNAGGETLYLSTCERDPEEFYTIAAETTNCNVMADYDAGLVFDPSELVYRNANNTRVIADSCLKREDAQSYPIVETEAGCDLRHDFAGGVSFKQTRKQYAKGGQTFTLVDCADTDTSYDHVQVTLGCTPIVDFDGRTVSEAQKIQITVDGATIDIQGCTPTGSFTSLVETLAGCEALHYDYFSANYSRGASRWYYVLDGATTYVTTCQENTILYAHDYVVEGYTHDDTTRVSTERLAVYIDLPAPTGRTLVSAASVRAQSTALPYIFKETTDVPTTPKTYVGCEEYTPTARSQIYTRADGSEYAYATGAGPTTGPVDVCVSTVIDSRNLLMSMSCFLDRYDGRIAQSTDYWNYATVNKTEKKNTGTGETVSLQCSTSGGYSTNRVNPGETCTVCTAPGGSYGATCSTTVITVPPCPF